MQNLLYSFILVIFISGTIKVAAQELNFQLIDENGKEKLLGLVDEEGLRSPPFHKWFNMGYSNYEVDLATIQSIKNELKNYSIKIFMGTWCGDSKREVPRFYKVLMAANYPEDQLITVAVDYVKPNYKKSPGGEEKGLNIIKVPTFIFYRNGKEVNRIIEFPVDSFEKDIEAIVSGNSYVPNYSNIPNLPVD